MQNLRQHVLWRILGALGLALPTLYWSPMLQSQFHYSALSFPMSGFVPALFATGSLALFGRPRFGEALREIRSSQPANATLASLALTTSFLLSLFMQVVQTAHLKISGSDFWWQLALLVLSLELSDAIIGASLKRVHLAFSKEFAQTGNAAGPGFTENPAATATHQYSFWSVLGIIGIALVAATIWAFGSEANWAYGVERFVSVLAIASALSVTLIAPLIQRVTLDRAKRESILVQDHLSFDSAHKVDLVLFDKTGVLTTGTRKLEGIRVTRRGGLEDEDELLAVIAGLESQNDHYLAQAIRVAAAERNIEPVEIRDHMNIPGIGVSGRIGEYRMSAGGPALLTRQKIDIEVQDLYAADAMNSAGQTVIYLVRDSTLLGLVGISDEARPESADAVWEIHALRKKAGLLTGDAQGVARALAKQLEIDEVFAEVLPQDKAAVVERLQSAGKRVAFAGDANTDAAAISQANLGIAFGVERDTEHSADVGISGVNPETVADLLKLSKRARDSQVSNLWLAGAYNGLAVLLASGVVAGLHQVLLPAVSALISAAATAVVINRIGGLWSKR